ncbi:MAG: class I SAM-dependent methyltransferase [Gemmatimonadales bacterium]
MFTRTADLYDLIYRQFKDYRAEARIVAGLIRELHPTGRSILDAGCGTGEHARFLVEDHGYTVDGFDVEPAFVEIAGRKVPSGRFSVADMAAVDLGTRYDVVLSLFSSIGYLVTPERTTAALACFGRHLRPGGVVLVEPWMEPADFHAGRVYTKLAESAEVSVCRMSHSEVRGRVSRLTFEYLVGRPGQGIVREREIHELGLLTREEMLACFRAAGLEARYRPDGPGDRGLYVGTIR